jgi:hypothetical protein
MHTFSLLYQDSNWITGCGGVRNVKDIFKWNTQVLQDYGVMEYGTMCLGVGKD